MGIRQEHDKVLKLQVLQGLYGMVPYHERAQHEASFESAYRAVLGETWDQTGLSLESADGLGHYLRGVHSVKGTPVHLNQRNLMRGLRNRVLSLESRLATFEGDGLAAAIRQASFESNAGVILGRYGLSGLSLEAEENPTVWKNLVAMVKNLFKPQGSKTQKIDVKFDARNVDYKTIEHMADYIDECFINVKDKGPWEPVEGKISGEGIVKNLTWGTEFDEKNPLAFLKKKFADWDKWYHAYEKAAREHSKVVMDVEKVTRPAVMAVKDDDEKIEDLLDKGIERMKAAPNPVKAAGNQKILYPGARILATQPIDVHNCFGLLECKPTQGAKDIKQLRPLTQAEAIELLTWVRDHVRMIEKYSSIYEVDWSDHSDGNPFWDVIEDSTGEALYGSMIYWQNNDMDFFQWVDGIEDMMATLSNGVMNWVTRSFK